MSAVSDQSSESGNELHKETSEEQVRESYYSTM